MEEQDLKQIWKSASGQEEVTINTHQLMKDFENKMQHREGIVRRRDRREIIGALVGVISFSYSFFAFPNTVSQIGSVLGLFTLIHVVYKLRMNRKSKVVPELAIPIREQLHYQHQFMLKQYKLLDTVMYWLSIPIIMANTLLIWGISKSEKPLTIWEQVITAWESKFIITIVLVIVFAYIGWMNKKAAQVNWQPLIKQINTIINNLKEEEK